MAFGLSAAAIGAVALGGATLASGVLSAKASKNAANTQAGASQAGIDEQRRQFEQIQTLLQPYVTAGTTNLPGLQPFAAAGAPALAQQQAFLGLGGPQAQSEAVAGVENSPLFRALTRQGEDAILQNASATGGIRGGNVQGALAQFRPQMLQALIDQQYQRLGGMTALGANTTGNLVSIGQNAAAGTGNAGTNAANNISELLAEQGAARAGGQLNGNAFAAIPAAISSGLGAFTGFGGKF